MVNHRDDEYVFARCSEGHIHVFQIPRQRRLRNRNGRRRNLVSRAAPLPCFTIAARETNRNQITEDVNSAFVRSFDLGLLGVIVTFFLFFIGYSNSDYFHDLLEVLDAYHTSAARAYIKFFKMTGTFLIEFITGIFKYILRFLELLWHVLHLVLNCATYIGGWFLGNIAYIVKQLDDHFPGGILGIAFSIFVIIVVVKVLQKIQLLLIENTRCKEEQLKLQLKLEDSESRLQTETMDLKRENLRFKEKIFELEQKILELNSKMKSLEEEKDSRLCGICQDRIKTILLLPCQHMCLCKQCLDRKKWKKCPICRQCVESTIQVYV